jgi:hypothetical protein
MAGFPTLGAVTPVSGLLALEPAEQALRPRPALQQSRTATAFLLIIPVFLSLHGQACRSAASGLVREARSDG